MPLTHTISQSFSQPGIAGLGGTIIRTGTAEANISAPLAAATTDNLQTVSLTVAQMLSLFLLSDVALTIEANSASVPTFTITLAAGAPLIWTSGNGTNPFTADVTALYLTCTLAANFEMRCLYNS